MNKIRKKSDNLVTGKGWKNDILKSWYSKTYSLARVVTSVCPSSHTNGNEVSISG